MLTGILSNVFCYNIRSKTLNEIYYLSQLGFAPCDYAVCILTPQNKTELYVVTKQKSVGHTDRQVSLSLLFQSEYILQNKLQVMQRHNLCIYFVCPRFLPF